MTSDSTNTVRWDSVCRALALYVLLLDLFYLAVVGAMARLDSATQAPVALRTPLDRHALLVGAGLGMITLALRFAAATPTDRDKTVARVLIVPFVLGLFVFLLP